MLAIYGQSKQECDFDEEKHVEHGEERGKIWFCPCIQIINDEKGEDDDDDEKGDDDDDDDDLDEFFLQVFFNKGPSTGGCHVYSLINLIILMIRFQSYWG